MQETFGNNADLSEMFKKSLSGPRFRRYVSEAKGDDIKAFELYKWNSLISQSLYVYLQAWEICLRNKVASFLAWKYNESWPYDQIRAIRSFKGDDKRRITETIQRQEHRRGIRPVPTSAIIADLSAGFWVSQLSPRYAVTYSWRYNVTRIFPLEKGIDMQEAWRMCDELLNLRNRVAHHEPIYHLPLTDRLNSLRRIVGAMCGGTLAFAERTCTFEEVWSARPF